MNKPNKERLTTAEQIVLALAATFPRSNDRQYHDCGLCDAANVTPHTEDCPWQAAQHYITYLTKTGAGR